jgi:hypothetical protein
MADSLLVTAGPDPFVALQTMVRITGPGVRQHTGGALRYNER